jgi:hypothetical protein
MEGLVAGLTFNLTNSVSSVGKTLRRMLDALAETGMRHAHREISRGRMDVSKRKRKSRTDKATH